MCVTLLVRSPAAVCWIKLIRTCNKGSRCGALCAVRSSSGVVLMLWFHWLHPLCHLRMSKHMDTLLKSKDDKVSRALMQQAGCRLWSECVATVMLAGSRPYGRPQGLVQAFPPSHFSSLLLRGFTEAPTRCSTNLSGCHTDESVGMSAALGRNHSVSKNFGYLTYLWPWH